MKFIYRLLIGISLIVTIYVFQQIIRVEFAKSHVNDSLSKELVDIRGQLDISINNIIFVNFTESRISAEIAWGDSKVRLKTEDLKLKSEQGFEISHLYEIVQVKEPGQLEWENFIKMQSPFCDAATIWNNQLFCISATSNDINLNIISKDGKLKTRPLKKGYIYGNESILRKGDKVYIIWKDSRLFWPILDPLYDTFINTGKNLGPWLIMAGELNLDTLEFKEHVIKYNSSTWP